MPFHRALPLDELVEGVATRIMVDGQAVLLALIDGVPRAVTDVCPHNGASLADGVLRGACVTCPAHLWRFSLIDGTRQGRPDVRILVFPCRVANDGWIEVDLPEAQRTTTLREALLDHARQGPVR